MPLKTKRDEVDTTLEPNGQQRDYLVLSEEERAKGFVRPVRLSYLHVGTQGPKGELRDLTADEQERYAAYNYVKFEVFPPDPNSCAVGRFWTQARLDNIGKGCRSKTTMARPLAETYARNPEFYGGTFCSACGTHFPVGAQGEFVWEDGTRVGT